MFGVELGGLVQADEFDVLNITGTARLDGTLEVELIDGFVPNVGNMFQILTAGSVIDTFESVIAFDGANLFDLDVSVLYSATDVVVQIDDLALSGDYNQNGIVDAADYSLWRDTLGEMGMDLAADGNENGQVDAPTTASGAPTSATPPNSAAERLSVFLDTTGVPEPTAHFMLILAITAFCLQRRALAVTK